MLAVGADVVVGERSRRRRRGEVTRRGSLVAVDTADVSRAEFSRMFSKEMLDLV